MFAKDEEQILNAIKYTPSLIVFILGSLIALFLYTENKQSFDKEKELLTQNYIQQHKREIKQEVERIYNYIDNEQKHTEKNLKTEIQECTDVAHVIVRSIYEKNYQIKSKLEITKMIQDALRDVRYNEGRGYFFIYDMEGNNIFHPIDPKGEGKNHFYDKDVIGNYRTQELIKIVKEKNEGFLDWYFTKPNVQNVEFKKIGFVKYFKPYNWLIGTGEYVEDYTNELQTHILEYINHVKYGKNGYIVILTEDGIVKAHIDKNEINTTILNTTQFNNPKKIFDKMKTIADSGGGYFSFVHKNKPNQHSQKIKKINYYRSFDTWKWIIGTGFYEDDLKAAISEKKEALDKRFTEHITKVLLMCLFITLALLILSILASIILRKKFQAYKKDVEISQQERNMQHDMLLKVQKAAMIGSWEIDLNTMDVHWSDQVLKIFGLDGKTFSAGPEFLKSIMHEDDISCFEASLEQALKYGTEHRCTYRLYKPDGEMIWIDCIGIVDPETNIISGTVQNITELKNKDEMLITQSRLAAMGEMIGMIAHQWRQPISVIAVQANSVKIDVALNKFDTKDAIKFTDNILEQTQHLSKTIDDFRNFFKPDKAPSKAKIEIVLDGTFKIVKNSLDNYRIKLETSYDSDTELTLYPRELMQVFVNIINNAKDALVSNKVKDPTIFIKVYENKNTVITEICDNGGGIDTQILSKIFDPYFSTKDEKTGTGLGLYMSKMIIEDHLHGSIEAHNKQKGSCFIVRLPK